jgi:pimeloyl-ACP methyl ester carboxylesterase
MNCYIIRRILSGGIMDYINVNDLKICYSLKGEGYPIVLIMGFTAGMDWWDSELIDALAEKYSVLIFDNRGAGRTVTPADGDFSINMFADDTAALMDALSLEKAHVFGFSMGGIIAQALTLRYPDKVNKLVLGGTCCGGKETLLADPAVIKKLMDADGGIEGSFSRTLELMFPEEFISANSGFSKDFRERYMAAPVSGHNARRQLAAIMKRGTYPDLPGIKSSTLVVTGTEDILIPPQNSHILAERIPHAELIEYEGAGHCFMSPKREEFLKDIFEFLDN